MLSVSDSLLSCRRAISSPMFSELSLPTRRNSSILACRSAIGCSKSRKFGFIGIRHASTARRPGGCSVFCAIPYGTGASRSNKSCSEPCPDHDRGVLTSPRRRQWIGVLGNDHPSSVLQEDVVAPELVTQCLNQVVCRIDPPVLAKLQQRARIAPGVFQSDRTGTAMPAAHIGKPAHPIALERLTCHLHAQTLGQTGACLLQTHHPLGAQA